MQIIPFPAHYQLVYANFDFSSFSRISCIANVRTMQRRGFYVDIQKDVFGNINALIMQRRRCCSFDSPGLARNEPTPGKCSQGDSTL